MELAHLSAFLQLFFWGGMVWFMGEAIIAVFAELQEKRIPNRWVSEGVGYASQGFLERIGYLFTSGGKLHQCVLVGLLVLYAVCSGILIDVLHESIDPVRNVGKHIFEVYFN